MDALQAAIAKGRAFPGTGDALYSLGVTESPAQLLGAIDRALGRDRHFLRQRLRRVEQLAREGKPFDVLLHGLVGDIAASTKFRAERAAGLPKPIFPADLPVVQRREEIARAIEGNQVIVLCGETGSGKTTQLPKICLALGRGVDGMIGHTQPRRIAARSVAARIAQELDSPLGHAVGYKVRFSDQLSPQSYVKLMTDGILLAETQGDRYLNAYDTIIIDEAHERSLNIDFLLGYLKQLLPRRRDLKLIITSATIDPRKFSRHFNDAPIIEVSERTYPVEVRHRPLTSENPEEDDISQIEGIIGAIDELWREAPGDTLVFLAGEREIRETAEALRKHHPPGVQQMPEILPLFARLSADDQNKVFAGQGRRRIVLSTNVAETSLTVPGIKYVIDPGFARISRYSPRTKIQRLPIEKVSRASADQRKGRCGRVSEGICVRLYSATDFEERAQFTEPEIWRTNLASVILQMTSLRLGDVSEFPFVEPPDHRMIKDGYHTLHELGAIDERNQLTETGQALAKLPLDPRIGRMILAAAEEHCLAEVLVIAAALSVQDPRERPMDKQELADAAHAAFRDETSDFVSYLKIWKWYHDRASHLSTSKIRRACQENFLSYVRMREWHDTHRQLRALVTEMGMMRGEEDEANKKPRTHGRGRR
jgi:ATP-dependent helicase HrpA